MTAPELPEALRPLTPAGERLVAAASELFYDRGIHAVGVDLIAEVAETTKKTLYDRFGSKEGLVVLYLQRRQHRWREFVSRHLDEMSVDRRPPWGPLGVLDALELWMAEQSRGCAFVNAYAELGGSDHPGVEVIRSEKQWTQRLYRRLCEEDGLPEPEQLAAAVHLVHEGVLVLATAGAQPDAFAHGRRTVEQLLAAAAGQDR
ncbi:MAG TPA: helix-turn-helix domain-containing protein [Nocardioidaceae bacterium]|nr:helix-turn-helix domain-containing protein [Nocardioidaceae bacterium]